MSVQGRFLEFRSGYNCLDAVSSSLLATMPLVIVSNPFVKYKGRILSLLVQSCIRVLRSYYWFISVFPEFHLTETGILKVQFVSDRTNRFYYRSLFFEPRPDSPTVNTDSHPTVADSPTAHPTVEEHCLTTHTDINYDSSRQCPTAYPTGAMIQHCLALSALSWCSRQCRQCRQWYISDIQAPTVINGSDSDQTCLICIKANLRPTKKQADTDNLKSLACTQKHTK